MVCIDKNQEAISRIQMVIDDNHKAQVATLEESNPDIEESIDPLPSMPSHKSHWSFGAPGKQFDSCQFEESMILGDWG
jgi:hypothetical protein